MRHTQKRQRSQRRGEPRRGSLTAGLSFGAVSFLGTTAVGLFTSIFIARLYGITVVGQFALVYAPVLASWLLSTVREQPALIRAAAILPPRDARVTALFYAVFTFSSVLTVVVSAISAIVVYFVFHGPIKHPGLFAPSLVSLAAYTVFTNTCVNFDSVYIAFRDGRGLFWLRMHQAIVYLVLVVALRPVSGSVWSLVAATGLSWAFPCVHRFITVRKWMRFRVSRAEIREGFTALPEMLRFGLKLTPGSLLWGACDQIGTWVLGSVSSIAAVGAYNRAWFVAQRFLDARQKLSELLFPTLVERRESGDNEGFDRALMDSLRYTTAFLLLFAGVGGGAATGIMSVFGPGFSKASTALIFLLLVPVSTTMVSVLSQALIANNRPLVTSITAGVRLIATFPAVVILTHTDGITGTALGMAFGGAAQLVCQLVVSQRDVLGLFAKLWPRRQVIGQVAAYAGGFGAARGVYVVLPGYGGLVVALVLGTLAYFLILWLIGGLLERDRVRIDRMLVALTSRIGPLKGISQRLAAGQAAARAVEEGVAAAGPEAWLRPEDDTTEVRLGLELEAQGDVEGAQAAYARADEAGGAAAACNLGVLLEAQGDLEGAAAAYGRADERGDAAGAFNLGLVLEERGDRTAAEQAYARADARGHPSGACNLGVLLQARGELERAREAYTRAQERGDVSAAFNLGLMLSREGAGAGARTVFERIQGSDGELGELARTALEALGEIDGADARRSGPRHRLRVLSRGLL